MGWLPGVTCLPSVKLRMASEKMSLSSDPESPSRKEPGLEAKVQSPKKLQELISRNQTAVVFML